jgi:hypothetical protein
MRSIADSQERPAGAELNLISVKERHRFGNSLAVDQRAVETLEVANRKLIAALPYLCVAARDDCGGYID